MLEDIKIRHLSFRKLSSEDSVPWGKFNIVWTAESNPDDLNYALELSRHRTKSLTVKLTIPALDPDNFEQDDYDYQKHDLVRTVGFNDYDYVNHIEKFNVFRHVEYAALTPPTLAIYEELKILQEGGSLNYRATDDCVFFSHIDTIHLYWD